MNCEPPGVPCPDGMVCERSYLEEHYQKPGTCKYDWNRQVEGTGSGVGSGLGSGSSSTSGCTSYGSSSNCREGLNATLTLDLTHELYIKNGQPLAWKYCFLRQAIGKAVYKELSDYISTSNDIDVRQALKEEDVVVGDVYLSDISSYVYYQTSPHIMADWQYMDYGSYGSTSTSGSSLGSADY